MFPFSSNGAKVPSFRIVRGSSDTGLMGTQHLSWETCFSTQIDETGSTIFAMESYYQTLKQPLKAEFLGPAWTTILSAAEYLMRRTSDGLHEDCLCLWKVPRGSFYIHQRRHLCRTD
ncbi:MAG: hypothetical protein R2741_13935 [Methanolobus sp.]